MLADVAKAKGVERLEPGYAITVADVEAALGREKVTIEPGDVVLVHTGWGGLWGKDNARFLSGEPGPGLELVRWLYDRRIAALGTDFVEHRPGAGGGSGSGPSSCRRPCT